MTNKCKKYWSKPNPIYDDGTIYIGIFENFQDAAMLPINTTWCITQLPDRYKEFNEGNSRCLYIINNHNKSPYKNVLAVVCNAKIQYWDSTNHKIEDSNKYEKTLTVAAENIIYNYAYKQYSDFNIELPKEITENKQYKNMKTNNKIRLTESQLHQVIKESVKKILREDTRFPSYKHSSNPLFTSDEAKYWDTMALPDDIEYQRILKMVPRMDKNTLYKKLGHDKYNAFVMRLEEDNPEMYKKFIYDPDTYSDELPW